MVVLYNSYVIGNCMVNRDVGVNIAELPFRYYSVERNCIEVPADDDSYDGCQEELTSLSEDFVKSIIEDYADVGDIDFDGEACYYNELTSSASVGQLSVVTGVCTTLAVTLLGYLL